MMLSGWTLLATHCPICNSALLKKQKQIMCAFCNMPVVMEADYHGREYDEPSDNNVLNNAERGEEGSPQPRNVGNDRSWMLRDGSGALHRNGDDVGYGYPASGAAEEKASIPSPERLAPPSLEDAKKEYDRKHRRIDSISARLGEKMLAGWTLLGATCPETDCCGTPLMSIPGGVIICVGCDQVFEVTTYDGRYAPVRKVVHPNQYSSHPSDKAAAAAGAKITGAVSLSPILNKSPAAAAAAQSPSRLQSSSSSSQQSASRSPSWADAPVGILRASPTSKAAVSIEELRALRANPSPSPTKSATDRAIPASALSMMAREDATELRPLVDLSAAPVLQISDFDDEPAASAEPPRASPGQSHARPTPPARAIPSKSKPDPSKQIAQKLMSGWALLDKTCPRSACRVPMMRDRDGKVRCVACGHMDGDDDMDEEEDEDEEEIEIEYLDENGEVVEPRAYRATTTATRMRELPSTLTHSIPCRPTIPTPPLQIIPLIRSTRRPTRTDQHNVAVRESRGDEKRGRDRGVGMTPGEGRYALGDCHVPYFGRKHVLAVVFVQGRAIDLVGPADAVVVALSQLQEGGGREYPAHQCGRHSAVAYVVCVRGRGGGGSMVGREIPWGAVGGRRVREGGTEQTRRHVPQQQGATTRPGDHRHAPALPPLGD